MPFCHLRKHISAFKSCQKAPTWLLGPYHQEEWSTSFAATPIERSQVPYPLETNYMKHNTTKILFCLEETMYNTIKSITFLEKLNTIANRRWCYFIDLHAGTFAHHLLG
jgi:hypothetical protein